MSYDHHDFEIEAFGFTPRQAYLFLNAMRGFLHPTDVPCSPDVLVTIVRDHAVRSHSDRKQFGRDLGFVSNDTAELPLEFEDLAEVLERLMAWQAQALLFYAVGFWRGIATAREPAAMRQAE